MLHLHLQNSCFRSLTHSHSFCHVVSVSKLQDLAERGQKARSLIMEAGLPDSVRKAVEESYRALCDENNGAEVAVAVRSSATAEDLPTASFAGQQSSFLNVVGAKGVADAVLECLASVFTDRAITYRVHNEFDHMAVKVKKQQQQLMFCSKLLFFTVFRFLMIIFFKYIM